MGGIDWDEFNSPTDGEFPDSFKFDTVGKSIAGTISNLRVTDFGGTADKSPELWITKDDGEQLSVVATQTRLKQLLAQERPNVGDRIAIVYTGDGERTKPGFNPPKQFDVVVKRAADSTPAAATAEPQPVGATAGPAAADLV